MLDETPPLIYECFDDVNYSTEDLERCKLATRHAQSTFSTPSPPQRLEALFSHQISKANVSSARLPTSPTHTQTRTIFGFFRGDSSKPSELRQPPKAPSARKPSALAPGSILDSTDPPPSSEDGSRPSTTTPTPLGPARNPANMEPAINPRPVARARWQRKMVIRDIHKRGRINRATFLTRTERQSLSKSAMLATSVKKLGPLARQITGKTVDEAIVQMRFSPKRVAADVLKHLLYARDVATVTRGMGLPETAAEQAAHEKREAFANKESPPAWDRKRPQKRTKKDVGVVPVDRNGRPLATTTQPTPNSGVEVFDRKGKRRLVRDPKTMYVDQAWVGRGPYGREPDFRAKGQVFLMRPPFTSISLLLKEEATRIREQKERDAKAARKKVWVPLPDRPIPGQRQYLLW